MRATWDALASADTARYVGDPARGAAELDSLFGRLGADPRGGVCVEVGCGPGRMTGALAERFDRVVAVDVSPAMLERARASVPAPNVEFRAVSGERLDSVADGEADVLVCYLVLQHLPGRRVEVGCGPGRMTGALAERFDRVVAVDVSPAMLERARAAVPASNVDFRAVSGERLDGVADGEADVLVCYLVLQHLPGRRVVEAYLREFARVLAPGGSAFVQLPVLEPGLRPRLWRALRALAVPLAARLSRDPERAPAFRGFRLGPRELERALAAARLRVAARDEGPDAPYRHSRDLFLRLEPA